MEQIVLLMLKITCVVQNVSSPREQKKRHCSRCKTRFGALITLGGGGGGDAGTTVIRVR